MNEFLLSEVDWGAHNSSYFLYLVHIDPDAKPMDFFSKEMCGGLPQRTSFTSLIGLNHVEANLVHHLALQKGPNRMDHQWDQQWDLTQSLDHQLPSSDPDLCPRACLSLALIVLLLGHSYYLLKNLKYSVDTEDGFSNSKSIEQYRSSYTPNAPKQHGSSYHLLTQWDPGEKPLHPQLFRKTIATKISFPLDPV